MHLSIKTSLFSLYFNRPKFDYDGFLEELAQNNWKSLADIIESLKSNKSRRKAESLLLRSFKRKCDRDMYLSILIDESGSINQDDYQKEISFVKELINYNKENNKIFISLFTFSSFVTRLSIFKNNTDELIQELYNHKKLGGDTNTGEAILQSRSLFIKTESYIRGVLDSRILIIITDGQSNDTS